MKKLMIVLFVVIAAVTGFVAGTWHQASLDEAARESEMAFIAHQLDASTGPDDELGTLHAVNRFAFVHMRRRVIQVGNEQVEIVFANPRTDAPMKLVTELQTSGTELVVEDRHHDSNAVYIKSAVVDALRDGTGRTIRTSRDK
jgi:hypothetical protein